MNKLSNIGLIGLAVMGENLALNMERNGFQVSVYNRAEGAEAEVVSRFMSGRGAGKRFLGFTDLKDFVASIERPRKIMMMIRAGKPVDLVIEALLPYLEAGDIVVDGGNSNWEDSERREASLREHGVFFVGCGISGGEEGALNGPAIMPGGAKEAWPTLEPIFTQIAAKADDGAPCCSWIGSGGSGHFVKMVHNGIEYGDMQLIADAYGFLRSVGGASNEEMAKIFASWNADKLSSYLIEITASILAHKEQNGDYLIDQILDAAGQKGTGKWSVINSLEYGQHLGLIATAVYERSLSSMVSLRASASKVYGEKQHPTTLTEDDILALQRSLYASKIISYAQGFALLAAASRANHWELDLASIARVWRNGCIIRSSFLNDIASAYEANPELEHLLLAPYFIQEIQEAQADWGRIVMRAIEAECPVPAFSSALSYFFSLKTRRLPANMVQAQRDFFGAHTFERIDQPRGVFFHENWTGHGGDTSSSTYNI